MSVTHANPKVLEFYRELPFNIQESVEQQVRTIQDRDSVTNYPVLAELLGNRPRVLEIGCGAGWLSNNMAYHYGVSVTAIDFNPVAVERASQVASALGTTPTFEVADLFLYQPSEPADVAVSIGVLHHTNDCHAAIRRVLNDFVRPGGHAFIGLYHEYGRRPFLDHFAELAAAGADEQQLFERYCELMPQTTDETHARSWFRDQVIHPHETQHTLAEMLPILDECGFTLERTSINRFEPIDDVDALLEREKDYAGISREWLAQNRYFPGFFLFLARKNE
ncbi:MAG: class I SAM-dependent methyltransferase [Pseudomonadales bacterium]|jgi:2-polyprenyl-3-methyl-5-hydroxy-6-metoxy-1,4-benzoquinol methylase